MGDARPKYSKEVFRERLEETMKEFGENVAVAKDEVEGLIDLNHELLKALKDLDRIINDPRSGFEIICAASERAKAVIKKAEES